MTEANKPDILESPYQSRVSKTFRDLRCDTMQRPASGRKCERCSTRVPISGILRKVPVSCKISLAIVQYSLPSCYAICVKGNNVQMVAFLMHAIWGLFIQCGIASVPSIVCKCRVQAPPTPRIQKVFVVVDADIVAARI